MKDDIKIIVVIMLIMGLVAYNQAGKANNDIDIETKTSLTQLNLEFIESKVVDVTGDGNKDNVLLLGSKLDRGDSPFRENLMIVVQESKSKKYLKATYENFTGYEPNLIIREFTGDNIADVMVVANSGGSGGIYHHLIASFKDNEVEVIFDKKNNKGLKVSGQFIPNFKAELEFLDLNKKALIDISANKREYLKLQIYNQNGDLVKKRIIRPYSHPFSKLEPVDYNNDGQYELKGIQRIVGANNSDTISGLESIWTYEDNKWKLVEASYNTFLLKY